jgi:hypothetical protein
MRWRRHSPLNRWMAVGRPQEGEGLQIEVVAWGKSNARERVPGARIDLCLEGGES